MLDFGIVRDAADNGKDTAPGQVLGSVAYMSVEQAMGAPVDARADVYSLGVVMYEMLVGKNPFDTGSYNTTLIAVYNDTPPPVVNVVPGVPAELSALVARLMSKDRDGRPKDAAEALAELKGINQRVKATPDNLPSTPSRIPAPPATQPPLPMPVARNGGSRILFEIAPGVAIPFCWVPAGVAILGSSISELGRSLGEEEHSFATSGFWLGRYLVTQTEWMWITGKENPSRFNGKNDNNAKGIVTDRFPVETVSWYDAAEFCNRVSVLLGKSPRYARLTDGRWKIITSASGCRLPNEDEWEYACRGGLADRRPFYFGDTLNGDRANCDGTQPYGAATKGSLIGRPTAVGRYESASIHPWGLCDMHGNAWEWCENQTAEGHRVLRGGSWSDEARCCRTAYRFRTAPDAREDDIGFRLLIPD